MAGHDSILDAATIADVRTLLTPRARHERVWPVLAAAAALMLASLVFAAAMVVAPPVTTEHTAASAP